MPRRPAFRGSVFGSRAEHNGGGIGRQTQGASCRLLLSGRRVQPWSWKMGRQRSGQRGIALYQLRMQDFIQPMASVQKQVARLALIAGAKRNGGEERDQRRFPRVGQHVGFGIALAGEAVAKGATGTETEVAVTEGIGNHRSDLVHARQQRRRPVGRQHVDPCVRVIAFEKRQQRLGENRVADPRTERRPGSSCPKQQADGAQRPNGAPWASRR
jgi:hypothetical protein